MGGNGLNRPGWEFRVVPWALKALIWLADETDPTSETPQRSHGAREPGWTQRGTWYVRTDETW